MNALPAIRKRLGLTQEELGLELGMSQGNVSFCENGQRIQPDDAIKLTEVARKRGLHITLDHVYGLKELPATKATA